MTSVNSFALLPFLLRGTHQVILIQERLAHRLQDATHIRLLEPPVPVPPLVVTMFWSA
jgi:hypothetical protein